MAAPTLITSVDGRLRPRDNIFLAQLAWDAPADTLSTIIQRKRASGQWEDVVTVGRFLPQTFVEYVSGGLRTYRVVRTRRVNGSLVEEISNEQTAAVGLNVSSDNGFDPTLGAPLAPKHYQMFVVVEDRGQGLQVYLSWTVPDVLVDLSYDQFSQELFIYVRNYFQDPAVAAQSGNTVTISGGVFIPDSETPNFVGYQIRWKNGGTAVISSATETTATVTPSQTIPSGGFALIPPGPGGGSEFTTFDLHRWDEGDNWPRIGESTNSYPADNRVDWLDYDLTGTEQMAWRLDLKEDLGGPVYGFTSGINNFYVRAVSGSIEKFSQIISITV